MARGREQRPMTKAEYAQYLRDCAATCMSDTARPYEPLRPSSEHRRFDPPRTPVLAGAGGLRLLMAIPGFVEQWRLEDDGGEAVWVPRAYLTRASGEGPDPLSVSCTCGGEPGEASTTDLEDNAVTECEDRCGRWFWRFGDEVLCRRFTLGEAAAA